VEEGGGVGDRSTGSLAGCEISLRGDGTGRRRRSKVTRENRRPDKGQEKRGVPLRM